MVHAGPHALWVARDPDSPAATPRYLTLLHPDRALVPWGVVVSPWPGAVRVGQGVRVSGRGLAVGEREVGRLVGAGVGLVAAPVARDVARPGAPGLPALDLPARTARLLGRLDAEAQSLDARLCGIAAARLAELVRALRRNDVDALPGLVSRLSGLGPGSTPTGDDLLVGLAAMTWRLAARGAVAPATLVRLCTVLAASPAEATTPLAKEMLREAAVGAFPEPLLRFCETYGDPAADRDAARPWARRLCRLGAHSGADLLAGALSPLHLSAVGG